MEETKTTPRPERAETGFTPALTNIKRAAVWFVAGLFVGAVLLAVFRYINLKAHHTHYHANFALYLNGQQDEFKAPTYYEEVQTCGDDPTSPRSRVHMHNMEGSSVHVHDGGATWGAFFANLGYTLGNNLIRTSGVTYIDGLGGSLTFILNGEEVVDVANRTIKDRDVLLISYGSEDKAMLKQRYEAIQRTAEHLDSTTDPAACAGDEKLTWRDRLKAAIGLN